MPKFMLCDCPICKSSLTCGDCAYYWKGTCNNLVMSLGGMFAYDIEKDWPACHEYDADAKLNWNEVMCLSCGAVHPVAVLCTNYQFVEGN